MLERIHGRKSMTATGSSASVPRSSPGPITHDDAVALAGFATGAAIALHMVWKILRTPGEL